MADSVRLSSDLQNLAAGAQKTCTGLLMTIRDVNNIDLEEFKGELPALVTTLRRKVCYAVGRGDMQVEPVCGEGQTSSALWQGRETPAG
jgi:hypothetical protein